MLQVSSLLTVSHNPNNIEGCIVIASKSKGGRATLSYNDSPPIEILKERIKAKWFSSVGEFTFQDWRFVPHACKLPTNNTSKEMFKEIGKQYV